MSETDRSLTAATARAGSASPRLRGAPQVNAAIAEAARRTGSDFDYLLSQARLESGLNPMARARTSSAAGLYQFIDSTWLQTLSNHGARHGLGDMAAAISFAGDRPFVADPAMRQQIMALRLDPEISALMAGELAQDNRASLIGTLGREPDNSELYLAHFLGASGAGRFLTALDQTPDASAADLMPRAAAANRAIFFGAGGAERSLSEVMAVIRGKVAAAGGDVSPAQMIQRGWSTQPAPQLRSHRAFDTSPPLRPSMAETLQSAFALADHGSPAARDHVRGAYAKLQAFGL